MELCLSLWDIWYAFMLFCQTTSSSMWFKTEASGFGFHYAPVIHPIHPDIGQNLSCFFFVFFKPRHAMIAAACRNTLTCQWIMKHLWQLGTSYCCIITRDQNASNPIIEKIIVCLKWWLHNVKKQGSWGQLKVEWEDKVLLLLLPQQ